MIPYMVGKLAPISSHLTRGLVKYVPGRSYFRAVSSHNGVKFVTSPIRSTIEGGRGCNKCVPVLRGNGTKIAPTGYIFDQPPGGMSWVRGKLAGHVGGHVVLSPEEGVLVTSPWTESSYPRPSQLLNNSPAPLKR